MAEVSSTGENDSPAPTLEQIRHALGLTPAADEPTLQNRVAPMLEAKSELTLEDIARALGVGQTPDTTNGRRRRAPVFPERLQIAAPSEATPEAASILPPEPLAKPTPRSATPGTTLVPASVRPLLTPAAVSNGEAPQAVHTSPEPMEADDLPAVYAPPPLPVRVRNPVMRLGMFFDEIAALNQMVHQRQQWIIRNGSLLSRDDVMQQHLMDFDKYKYTVKNRGSLVRELNAQRLASLPATHDNYRPHIKQYSFTPAQITFLDQPGSENHTLDADGFWFYLSRRHKPAVEAALKNASRPVDYPEDSRQLHTLIVGPSGWGKSELMKALLHHYALDGSAAVVVLDPGGDLVKQVSRWPELLREDRVRLIQPGLEEGFADQTVGINPLDGAGLGIEDRRVVAGDWALTLGTLTNDLSHNMRLLITMCVQVLLAVPGGATLDDLTKMLLPREKAPRGAPEKLLPPKDPRARQLLRFAQNYEVGRVARFFREQFDDESVETTRRSLLRRLEILLNYPHTEAMLTGTPTLNLEEEIEARRFILVDLSRFKKPGDRVMGRLFVALVAAIGRRRESQRRENRTPTHLFVDEASTMISAEMMDVLKEMRKWNLFMTLGQQVGGDEMTPQQKSILHATTGCKLIAPLGAAKDWLELPNDFEPPEVKPGQFLVSWTRQQGQQPIPLHRLDVRSDLKDYAHSVPDWEWHEHLFKMTGAAGYYRSAAVPSMAALDTLPEFEDEDDSPTEPPRRAPTRTARRSRPAPVDVPDDVPDELRERFRSEGGREGNW